MTLPIVADTPAAPRADDTRGPWIHGRLWDAVWIQSALWLVPLAFLLANGYQDVDDSPFGVSDGAQSSRYTTRLQFAEVQRGSRDTFLRPIAAI